MQTGFHFMFSYAYVCTYYVHVRITYVHMCLYVCKRMLCTYVYTYVLTYVYTYEVYSVFYYQWPLQ